MNVATLTGAKPASPEAPTTSADLAAIKARQHAAWSSGDYAVVGTTLQIVGEELCEALDLRSGRPVRDVAAGKSLLDPVATSRVLARLRDGGEKEDERTAQLTKQERRILDLIGEGMTNRQIGNELHLAEKTVKNYVSSLLAKMGMERRTQAAAYVARRQADQQH